MNSLNIGNSGNPFNLVPDKLTNTKFNKINQSFLKDIHKIQSTNKIKNITNYYNSNSNSNRKSTIDNQNSFKNEVLKMKNKNLKDNHNNTTNYETNRLPKNTHNRPFINNQVPISSPRMQENTNNNSYNMNSSNGFNFMNEREIDTYRNEKPPNIDVDWTEIFLTVCKKRLFNYFRELKIILGKDEFFRQKLICYIDEKSANFLVDNTKNDKIMTLRMILNNILNQQIKGTSNMNIGYSVNLNKALDLVKNLELMGPSNNLLIALTPEVVENLQRSYLHDRKLYWPNGNEGITWLTSFT